jgi:di/tripeptidase
MKEGILMTGFNNFIHLIQSQWTNIIVVIAIIATVIRTTLNYSALSQEQRVQSALKVINEELMKLMCQAEIQWKDYKKSGDLKRSQVIKDIYNQFPFLSKYMDQDALVKKIYEMIDKQMDNMNNLLNKTDDK